VELARTGSEPAFEAIVARYRLPLVRHCARMVGEADAEDAAQDALLNAHAALVRGAAVRQLAPWLYAIAQNTARNCLRARAARPATEEADDGGGASADGSAENRQELREVLAAVSALPDRQRDAIVMREFEGRSYEEIASRLGASRGAVRQLLNRARGSVRDRVRVLVPVEPFVRWALSRSSGANAAGGATLSGACILGAKVCVVALLPATVALTAPGPRHDTVTRSARSASRRIHIRTAWTPAGTGTTATGMTMEGRLRPRSTSPSAYTHSFGIELGTPSATNTPARGPRSSVTRATHGDRPGGRLTARGPGSAGRSNAQAPAALTVPTRTPSTPSTPQDTRSNTPATFTGPTVSRVSSDSPPGRNPGSARPAVGPSAMPPPQSLRSASGQGGLSTGRRGSTAAAPRASNVTPPTAAPGAGSDMTLGGSSGPYTAGATPRSGARGPSGPGPIANGDFSPPDATGVPPAAGAQHLPGASARPGGFGFPPAADRGA
jgi:RNA polymerase sigma factor (sigma-70 family)